MVSVHCSKTQTKTEVEKKKENKTKTKQTNKTKLVTWHQETPAQSRWSSQPCSTIPSGTGDKDHGESCNTWQGNTQCLVITSHHKRALKQSSIGSRSCELREQEHSMHSLSTHPLPLRTVCQGALKTGKITLEEGGLSETTWLKNQWVEQGTGTIRER